MSDIEEGESPWDSQEGGILLGAKEWVEQIRHVVKGKVWRGWMRPRTTRCCLAGFHHRNIWGNRRGGGGWKCCATSGNN